MEVHGGAEVSTGELQAESPVAEEPVAELVLEPAEEAAAASSAIPFSAGACLACEAVGVEQDSESAELAGASPTTLAPSPGTAQQLDDVRLGREIARVISSGNLGTMSLKQLRAQLEHDLGLQIGSLDEHKSRIACLAQLAIQEMQAALVSVDATPPRSGQKSKSRRAKVLSTATPSKKKRRVLEHNGTSGQSEHGHTDTPLDFQQPANSLRVQIEGKELEAPVRTFSSGASGFYTCRRLEASIGGQQCQLQCLVQCVIIDSKAPRVDA